jgi:hypothetical protein
VYIYYKEMKALSLLYVWTQFSIDHPVQSSFRNIFLRAVILMRLYD